MIFLILVNFYESKFVFTKKTIKKLQQKIKSFYNVYDFNFIEIISKLGRAQP